MSHTKLYRTKFQFESGSSTKTLESLELEGFSDIKMILNFR